MPVYLTGPSANPLARLLAALLGVLALVGAVFFGVFVFVAAIAVGLVVWAFVAARLWWLRRRLGSAGVQAENPFARGAERSDADDPTVIDADYEVVSRDQDTD